MPDDDLAAQNARLKHEREVLVYMVRRAAREIPGRAGPDIIADLNRLLAESPLGNPK